MARRRLRKRLVWEIHPHHLPQTTKDAELVFAMEEPGAPERNGASIVIGSVQPIYALKGKTKSKLGVKSCRCGSLIPWFCVASR
jgi:hypothetical protein